MKKHYWRNFASVRSLHCGILLSSSMYSWSAARTPDSRPTAQLRLKVFHAENVGVSALIVLHCLLHKIILEEFGPEFGSFLLSLDHVVQAWHLSTPKVKSGRL